MNVCDRIKNAINEAARDRTLRLKQWEVIKHAVAAGIADEKTIRYLKETLHGAGTVDDRLRALTVVRETGYVDPDILSGIYRCIVQEDRYVASMAVVTLGGIISQLSEDERIRICEQIRNDSWGPLLWRFPVETAYVIGNSGIRSVENLDVLTRLAESNVEDFGVSSRLYSQSAKEYETVIHVEALIALTRLGWGDIAKPRLEQIARVQKNKACDIAGPMRRAAINVLLQMDPNNNVALDALRAILSTLPTEEEGITVEDSLRLVRRLGVADKDTVDLLFEIAQKHPWGWGRAEAMKTLSRLPLKDRGEVTRVLRRGLSDSNIHTRSVALGALICIGEATADDISHISGSIPWNDFVEALWGIDLLSLPQEICSAYANPPSISNDAKQKLLALLNDATDEYQRSWGMVARMLLGGFNEHDVGDLIDILKDQNAIIASREIASMALSAAWLVFGCNQANK